MAVENYKDRLKRFKAFGRVHEKNDRLIIADYLESYIVGHPLENSTPDELSTVGRSLITQIDEVLDTPGLKNAMKKHFVFREEVVKELIDFVDEQAPIVAPLNSKSKKFQIKIPLFFFLKGNRFSSGKGRKGKKGLNFFQKLWDKITGGKYSRGKLSKSLNEKVEKFEQAQESLSMVYQTLGVSYGESEGLWRKVGFSPLEKYANFLQDSKVLQQLSDVLGRYHRMEMNEMAENLQDIEIKPYRTTLQKGKSDLVGIHESNDLSHLLASEASLLGQSSTKVLFYKKYVEKKLQTYELKATNKIYQQKKAPKKRVSSEKEQKGPVILCIDSSASMMGQPEMLSKTVALSLTRKAIAEKRASYLISFSKTIQTLALHELNKNVDNLLEFLSMSFRGGSDPTLALEHTLQTLEEESYKNADVLLLSDGRLPEFDVYLKHKIRLAQRNGNKFYAILFTLTEQDPIQVFDATWNCHPNRVEDLCKVADYFKGKS